MFSLRPGAGEGRGSEPWVRTMEPVSACRGRAVRPGPARISRPADPLERGRGRHTAAPCCRGPRLPTASANRQLVFRGGGQRNGSAARGTGNFLCSAALFIAELQ